MCPRVNLIATFYSTLFLFIIINFLQTFMITVDITNIHVWGVDPGFQVRGRTLKNRTERREAQQFLGYFVWKITILRKEKSYFFQFFLLTVYITYIIFFIIIFYMYMYLYTYVITVVYDSISINSDRVTWPSIIYRSLFCIL